MKKLLTIISIAALSLIGVSLANAQVYGGVTMSQGGTNYSYVPPGDVLIASSTNYIGNPNNTWYAVATSSLGISGGGTVGTGTINYILAGTGLSVSAPTGTSTISLITPVSFTNGGTGLSSCTNNYVLLSTGSGFNCVATSSLGITGGGGTNYFTNSGATTTLNTGTVLSTPMLNVTSTTSTSTIVNLTSQYFSRVLPPKSVVIILGESYAAGYGVNTIGVNNNAVGYTGPGYAWPQWLSVDLPNIPVYSYAISGSPSSNAATVLASAPYGATEYLNGAVVNGYSGTASLPSALVPASSTGGIAYFINTYDGLNDITSGISTTTYASNELTTFATERGYGSNVKIIGDTSTQTNLHTQLQTTPYNNWTRAELGTSTGIDMLADTSSSFTNNTNYNYYFTDGTHLNSNGYRIYADIFADAIFNGINKAFPTSSTLIDGSTLANFNAGITVANGNVTVQNGTLGVSGNVTASSGISLTGGNLDPGVNQPYLYDYHAGFTGLGSYAAANYQLELFTAALAAGGTPVNGTVNIGSINASTGAFTPWDSFSTTTTTIGSTTAPINLTVTGTTTSSCFATSTVGPCITGGGGGTNYFTNSGATTTLSTGSVLQASSTYITGTSSSINGQLVSASNEIIYASQYGCPLNSNLVTGGGTDATACLQSILDKLYTVYGGGTMVLDGPALISGVLATSSHPYALGIHPNETIQVLQGDGVFLASSSNVVMLSNYDVTGSTSAQVTWDSNMKVIGGIWNGNGTHQTLLEENSAVASTSGFTVGMWFDGFNGLELDNVQIATSRAFSFFISNGTNAVINNASTSQPVVPTGLCNPFPSSCYQDALHMAGTLSNVTVNGFTATNDGDDNIALNTNENVYSGNFTIASTTFGPQRYSTSGGYMSNISINNFDIINGGSAVRIYGVAVPGAVTQASTSNITFNNIYGNLVQPLPWATSLAGDNVTVSNNNMTITGYNVVNSTVVISTSTAGLFISNEGTSSPVILPISQPFNDVTPLTNSVAFLPQGSYLENGNVYMGNTNGTGTGSTTPLDIDMGNTYGLGAPGSTANMKFTLFHSLSGGTSNIYGIGFSAGLMEFQAGTGGGYQFFTNQGTPAMMICGGVGGGNSCKAGTNGFVGIGTSTPQSPFVVASSTTGVGTFFIDSKGHVITGGLQPTVSGGTSSMNSPSNDNAGSIAVAGTALTSVTMTFATPWTKPPICIESDNVLATAADITSISTTQIVFGFGTGGVTTATLWYNCQQPN